MLVGDRVGRHHVRCDALTQVLVGSISSIKAVAAVAVDGETSNRLIEAVVQSRPMIEIAVVGGHIAGDAAVLESRIDVSNCLRCIVGASEVDRERRLSLTTLTVMNGVVGD